MINTAVSGVDNYVEAGEFENQIMENVVDYLDSVVASISKEPQTFTDEEIAELIGKYVDYTPTSGTYKTVTGNSIYTGTDANNNDFTTDTSLHWRIWSIENGTLILIADDTAQSGGYNSGVSEFGYSLYLFGSLGYNNGVKILNDICKTCYSNSNLGATGRSINIQDIEEVLDWNVWAPTDYYVSSLYDSYTYISTRKYSDSSYMYYPKLWAQEDYSNIDGEEKEASYTYDSSTGTLTYEGNGLRRNSQTIFCTDSYEHANSYIELTQTYYYAAESTLSSAYINSKYSNLTNISHNYWLASRSTALGDTVGSYGLQNYNVNNSLSGGGLFTAIAVEYGIYDGILPMVEISLSSVTLDTETTSGDDSANALKLIAR